MAPTRQDFTDCWKNPSFAKKWVTGNTDGLMRHSAVRNYWLKCVISQLQGIAYLCNRQEIPVQPSRILDLGCGPGIRAAHIRAKLINCEVVGVDYSPAMIELGAPIQEALPPEHRVDLRQGDGNALEFTDGEFDVVMAYGLLMGVKEPQKMVAEMMRVSKFGIVAIEETPDVMSPSQRSEWEDVKDKKFPGRIFWHNYSHLFFQAGAARQLIADPLVADDEWASTLGTPACYARYIAVK